MQVILRTFEPEDTDQLFALVDQNRAHLRRFLPWLDFNTTVKDTARFIESLSTISAENGALQFGIFEGHELLGVVGQHPIVKPHRHVGLGYWLSEKAQGRGLMTAAVAWVTDLSFEAHKLHRVEIRAAVENHQSRAIPERLGFVHEGTLRECEWLYDHFVDHAIYSILAPDWQRHRQRILSMYPLPTPPVG